MAGMTTRYTSSSDKELLRRRGNVTRSLRNALDICVLLNNGTEGRGCVVVHPNSNGNNTGTVENVAACSLEALIGDGDFTVQISTILHITADQLRDRRRLALEVCAGEGKKFGRTLNDLAEVIGMLNCPGLGICLDTAHIHGVGDFDLSEINGTRDYLALIDELELSEKIFCLHLNDSKVALGSKKDRHETLGLGTLYTNRTGSLRLLLDWMSERSVPVILETPAGARETDYDYLNSLY